MMVVAAVVVVVVALARGGSGDGGIDGLCVDLFTSISSIRNNIENVSTHNENVSID